MQKLVMLHALTLDNTWKTSFLIHIVPFLAQKLQNKTFSKKTFRSTFSSYATVTWLKNQENIK